MFTVLESINVDMGTDSRETTFSQNLSNRNKVCVGGRGEGGRAHECVYNKSGSARKNENHERVKIGCNESPPFDYKQDTEDPQLDISEENDF